MRRSELAWLDDDPPCVEQPPLAQWKDWVMWYAITNRTSEVDAFKEWRRRAEDSA